MKLCSMHFWRWFWVLPLRFLPLPTLIVYLSERCPMKKIQITLEQVSQWVGSDFTREDFLKLLAELANEEYLVSHFANDILEIEN